MREPEAAGNLNRRQAVLEREAHNFTAARGQVIDGVGDKLDSGIGMGDFGRIGSTIQESPVRQIVYGNFGKKRLPAAKEPQRSVFDDRK